MIVVTSVMILIVLFIFSMREEKKIKKNTQEILYQKAEENAEDMIFPTEPLLWYCLTGGTYSVIRINSIDNDEAFVNGEQYIRLVIESLCWYSDRDEISNTSELYVRVNYLSCFHQGQTLFVQLQKIFKRDGKVYYKIMESNGELSYLPIVEGRLNFTEEFCKTAVYQYIEAYNSAVREYVSAKEEGRTHYMAFDFNYFYEGMSVNEINEFFSSLKKSKKGYEKYLENISKPY